jgi:hypothetical protein
MRVLVNGDDGIAVRGWTERLGRAVEWSRGEADEAAVKLRQHAALPWWERWLTEDYGLQAQFGLHQGNASMLGALRDRLRHLNGVSGFVLEERDLRTLEFVESMQSASA